MATILVADDMAVIRDPIAFALRKAGHKPITVSDGQEAVETIRSQRPDLLILDINMPKLDGLGILSVIRMEPTLRNIPVLMLTDSGDRETVLRAVELGADQYMLKSSFSMQEMLARVASLLEHGSGGAASRPSSKEGEAKPPEAAGRGETPSPTAPIRPETTETIKDHKPLIARSEVVERIASYGDLQALSPVVNEVIKLSKKPTTSPDQIAKLVRRDPGVATKLLRLANSAAYSSGSSVESVDRAVVVIGMDAIGQALLNIGVVGNFSQVGDASRIDIRLFWEHSIACGLIAARLARVTGHMTPDAAFTMGLIHDVGRLVFVNVFEDHYPQVLDVARRLALPVEQVESRLLLMNHAEGVDRLLHTWNFPRDLIDPIVFHHMEPEGINAKAKKRAEEVAILALADRLAHALMLGSSGNETLYTTSEFVEMLHLSPEAVPQILDGIQDETDNLKFSMLASLGGNDWPLRKDAIMAEIGGELNPIVVGSSGPMDSLSLFFEQLRMSGDAKPNAAVAYLDRPGHWPAMVNELTRLEAEAKAGVLPLMVISPAEDIKPPAELAAARAVHHVPSPASIPVITRTLRAMLSPSATNAAA